MSGLARFGVVRGRGRPDRASIPAEALGLRARIEHKLTFEAMQDIIHHRSMYLEAMMGNETGIG